MKLEVGRIYKGTKYKSDSFFYIPKFIGDKFVVYDMLVEDELLTGKSSFAFSSNECGTEISEFIKAKVPTRLRLDLEEAEDDKD